MKKNNKIIHIVNKSGWVLMNEIIIIVNKSAIYQIHKQEVSKEYVRVIEGHTEATRHNNKWLKFFGGGYTTNTRQRIEENVRQPKVNDRFG